jgi:hypothetical protein
VDVIQTWKSKTNITLTKSDDDFCPEHKEFFDSLPTMIQKLQVMADIISDEQLLEFR